MSIKTFLTYVPSDSLIARLASPTKIILPFFISVILLVVQNVFVNLLLLIAVIIIMFTLARPQMQFVKIFTIGAIAMSIMMGIFYLFLSGYEGRTLFQWGPVRIVDSSFYMWVSMVLRFLAMLYTTVIFLSTANQKDIITTAEWLRLPRSVSFILGLGFRNMLWFLDDISIVQEALKSRAMDFSKGGPVEKAKKFLSMFIPLVTLSIRRIPSISNAAEARAFKPSFQRAGEPFYETRFAARDYLVIVICVLVFGCFVALRLNRAFFLGYPI